MTFPIDAGVLPPFKTSKLAWHAGEACMPILVLEVAPTGFAGLGVGCFGAGSGSAGGLGGTPPGGWSVRRAKKSVIVLSALSKSSCTLMLERNLHAD